MIEAHAKTGGHADRAVLRDLSDELQALAADMGLHLKAASGLVSENFSVRRPTVPTCSARARPLAGIAQVSVVGTDRPAPEFWASRVRVNPERSRPSARLPRRNNAPDLIPPHKSL